MQVPYQVYDFASSARVERPLWLAFHNWMAKCSDLFVEQWSNFSMTPIQVSPSQIDAADFEVLQAQWNTPTYGAEVSFRDGATKGLLVINRGELIRLLMDILGDSSPEVPADRTLTTVEKSLCGLIFEQTASVIGQSWPSQESLSFSLEQTDDQPNRSRMFPPDKRLLTSGLQIKIANSIVMFQIVLAKQETCQLLGVNTQVREPNPNNLVSREKISEICVQISARLGSSELDMNDLVSMSAGDIIVLDQSVNEPLTVFANDEPVFRAWPGRVDQQQALNIESTHG
jgi:flagellar motor switch protein FliM